MMQRLRTSGGRRALRQEGAVMLVVMLILLVATALAGISLQSTQHELRAAGYNRLATQTQYVAEAALATTLSWIEETSMNGTFLQHVDHWQSGTAGPPDMTLFGEPPIDPAFRHMASRTGWQQQAVLHLNQTTLPPLNVANTVDRMGTFGPRSVHVPGDGSDIGTGGYVVDLYDCQTLAGMGSPGSQINQTGSGTIQERQYYCVVTARGRTYVPGAPTKTWTEGPGVVTRVVSRFMSAHDARGTVITPPIPVP